MTYDIGLIGVGKLGICLGLCLEKAGFKILCNDININLLDLIKNKQLISTEPLVEQLLNVSKNVIVTYDQNEIFEKNIIFILVPTPSLPDGSYDHSAIEHIVDNLNKYYKYKNYLEKKYIVICSTVMPKYCDNLQERLSKYNIEVNYSPEFIAQGTIIRDMLNPDIVLIGERSKESGDILENIYNKFVDNNPKICRLSPLEAEITKISLNCFLTTKIAFANCIGDLVKTVGGNPNKVLSAIGSDSRVGNKYLKWGYGFGGPCFPRDNRALNFFAKNNNIINNIGEATDKSNSLHLEYQYTYILNNIPKDNNILFTYITYKPDSSILEESQQLKLAIRLNNTGYNIYVLNSDNLNEDVKSMYSMIGFKFINSIDEINNFININTFFF